MKTHSIKIGSIFRLGFSLKSGKALHIIKFWVTMEGKTFRAWKRRIKRNKICPICGRGKLTKKSVEEVFDYKGETLKIKDYVIYECSACEESIVDRKILKETDPVLAAFRRKVDAEN